MATNGNLVKNVISDNTELVAVSSTSKLISVSDAEDMGLTPELRNKVFGNELIRDLIFDYVLCSDLRFKFSNVKSCRLVDHSWLDYVSCRFRKSRSWPMSLSISSLDGCRKFLDTWATFPGAGSRTPRFNLQFSQSSYSTTVAESEVADLVGCLTVCGVGLFCLSLNLSDRLFVFTDPIRLGLTNAFSGPMDFPNLRKFSVILPNGENGPLVSLMVPIILRSCKILSFLDVRADRYGQQVPRSELFLERSSLSREIEYLPNTLVFIALNVNLSPQLLANLLLENPLPKLTQLRLYTWEGGYGDVISRILDRFSMQLRTIFLERHLKSNGDQEPNSSSTQVNFPVMVALTEMFVTSFHTEHAPEMEQSFPQLKRLSLYGQTTYMMEKWTQKSHFISVKELSITIYTECSNDHAFSIKLSQQLPLSFPHVDRLTLTVGSWVEDGSLRNIFQHMTGLRMLSIRLKNTEEIQGASTWDAILLGVSPQYAKNLATSSRELWDSTNLNHHRTPAHSIVNLSNLKTLWLDADKVWKGDYLISDISFQFAFLRMSNLENLYLKGRFQASEEMVQEWRKRDRYIWEDLPSYQEELEEYY